MNGSKAGKWVASTIGGEKKILFLPTAEWKKIVLLEGEGGVFKRKARKRERGLNRKLVRKKHCPRRPLQNRQIKKKTILSHVRLPEGNR